ncbi:MAG: response regulator [Steroidobacteraceae bacterium]|jgi:twitching motility two-component system response regulator PilH
MAIKKVLICDDSSADRQNLEQILSKSGCVVISCASGRDAIVKAKAEKPDLIFLDIIMPDMNGYVTCRALQNDADTKGIPVVFVSSKGQKADKIWAQMQGGKDLVPKPFTADDIVAQLKKSA